ncbi:MAG: DUF1217 domain-containing protein [Paracoccaceae bacterium]|nr:MAG: DUF1217 domain-containing protein [Paracoccaceae bacterium]
MTFQPALPLGGYAGWAFLKRTAPIQRAAFERAPEVTRDEAYFRQKIGSVRTAEQLVSDRRLLKVALGAFGLDGDLGNKAFIRKVLEDGTLNETALANRLADKQYAAMSAAFGFGDFATPRTQLSDFADGIVAAYKTRGFEAAVGQQDGRLRLALNAERELKALADRSISDDAKWFTVMGSRPLRAVFEAALRLPTSFGALDIDRQFDTLREKARAAFGDDRVAQFSEPARLEGLIRRYLVMSDLAQTAGPAGMSGAAGALAILQAGQLR